MMYRRKVEAAPTLAERLRMTEGQEVHARARLTVPGGVTAPSGSAGTSDAATQVVNDPKTNVAYEVAFAAKPLVARVDILRRTKAGWEVIEVKSSTSVKPELVDDLAYSVMVCQMAELPVSSATLMLISNNFLLGMRDEDLFQTKDVTDDVLTRADELRSLSKDVVAAIHHPDEPNATASYACRECALIQECVTRDVENPIFEVPRIGEKKCSQLLGDGIIRIEDIPAGFALTETQRRVVEGVQSGRVYVGQSLLAKLAKVVWPAFYLDFETFQPVVPLYPDTAPYSKIPTQYSIHECAGPGLVTAHRDFLADPSRDCRRELAERLLRDLGRTGSIITYSSFEKTVVGELASLGQCAGLAADLKKLIARMVDLHGIVQSEYYDPRFHGSTSIKVVLPVLVPDLTYAGLAIADGDTALATFAYMARGELTGEAAEEAKANLREYCKRDTLAMVMLHERLANIRQPDTA
jgi:hypothetical protein